METGTVPSTTSCWGATMRTPLMYSCCASTAVLAHNKATTSQASFHALSCFALSCFVLGVIVRRACCCRVCCSDSKQAARTHRAGPCRAPRVGQIFKLSSRFGQLRCNHPRKRLRSGEAQGRGTTQVPENFKSCRQCRRVGHQAACPVAAMTRYKGPSFVIGLLSTIYNHRIEHWTSSMK